MDRVVYGEHWAYDLLYHQLYIDRNLYYKDFAQYISKLIEFLEDAFEKLAKLDIHNLSERYVEYIERPYIAYDWYDEEFDEEPPNEEEVFCEEIRLFELMDLCEKMNVGDLIWIDAGPQGDYFKEDISDSVYYGEIDDFLDNGFNISYTETRDLSDIEYLDNEWITEPWSTVKNWDGADEVFPL